MKRTEPTQKTRRQATRRERGNGASHLDYDILGTAISRHRSCHANLLIEQRDDVRP